MVASGDRLSLIISLGLFGGISFVFNMAYVKPYETTNNTIVPSDCISEIEVPPLVAPVCTKVVLKNQGFEERGTMLHIMFVNEFEAQYLECHKDLDAYVVPTDNCDPGKLGLYFEDEINADRRQFKMNCPSKCPLPAPIETICASCARYVFRTFLSACHLKMFSCRQPPETDLKIVLQQPCAASAPFLAKQPEPTVIDGPLRLIYCRARGAVGQAGC